ncbi:protein NETWORKED 4B-like [Zingiber officinale]|uniref:protein NETWORKED 4B-like n=1 Tax=Zingiber officinale TaxID=94328 RepID=UPI001C4CFBC8|nr:protein NETWORKED 4B-like [Zingiber officinale]XP_042442595.1 protein NETWORKED 4B-like [Zingiber officinale]
MKRMVSKKSHSWWWDSHISRRNSKWLEENLEKMDGSVKQMLKLIEEEGESFAKKAEMYYQRRPELISFVEDFYRMYRALAERYDQVTGDLRKNIESELRSQGSGSGRSSDMSRKGSEGSDSSSSEPDSESEFDAIDVNSDKASLRLQHRVHELETELSELKEKLEAKEKSDHDADEMEIVNLKQKLEEANNNLQMKETELGLAEKKTAELEERVEFLKGAAAAAAEKFQTDLLNEALAIEEYENELANEREKFLKEKSSLEEQILQLENANMDRVKHISELDEGIVSLKATVGMLTADKVALTGELKCRHDRVIEMEQQFHQLQMEYANLNKEKEELNEEVDRQKIVISDVAERKREAIRQLCFSIEHYRDNYCRLLGLLQNHKRSATVAN